MTIAPYTPDLEPAVHAFNGRMATAGVRYRFPTVDEIALPESAPIAHHGYVAVQDGDVRGGYLVQEQLFWVNGEPRRVGFLHLPLSEGLIDRRFGVVGVKLIAHALRRQPLLFGLGIGGRDETFARLVTALGWSLHPVPFLFRMVRPARVLRGLTALRRGTARRLALDVAALSGLGGAGVRLLQARWPLPRQPRLALGPVDAPGEGLGDLWDRCRNDYRFVACRDQAALGHLYASGSRPYLQRVLRRGSRAVGWCVSLDTQMSGHPHFGSLRLATIVDVLGEPGEAPRLIAAAAGELADRGVDLIVTNQSARLWTGAFRRAGFLTGPSNFFFSASPELARALSASGPFDLGTLHLTRGDGDGPLHL